MLLKVEPSFHQAVAADYNHLAIILQKTFLKRKKEKKESPFTVQQQGKPKGNGINSAAVYAVVFWQALCGGLLYYFC